MLPDAPGLEDLPECLRAGPCIEVWAPGPGRSDARADWNAPWWVARRAYKDAVQLWRDRQGFTESTPWSRMPSVLTGSSRPWSFVSLSQTKPDYLAQELRSRGLPPDWQPRPAPPEWRVGPRKRLTNRRGVASWHDERT